MAEDRSFDYIISSKPPSSGEPTEIKGEGVKPVRIKVIDKTNSKGQERRKVIGRIFEENKPSTDKQITITSWDEKEVTYQIQGESESHSIPLEGKGTAPKVEVHLAPTVSETESTSEHIAARLFAFGASYEKLFSENILANLLGPLWLCVILPVWAIYDSWNKLEEEARTPLLESIAPSGPEGFLEVLNDTIKVLQNELEGKDTTPLHQLQEGIKNGENLLKGVDDLKARENFLSNIREKIDKSSKEKPVLLPAGYYTDRGYQTALLSIYYNKETNEYMVQKFSLACEDPQHSGKIVPMLEYTLTPKNLDAFLPLLIALQEKPKLMAVSPEERKQLEALGEKSQRARSTEAISDPLSSLLGTGKISKETPTMKPSDDPLKLLFAYLKTTDQVTDKAQFMSHVLESAASHFLKYCDRLTPDRKEHSLRILDKRLQKLENNLSKDPTLAKMIVGPFREKIDSEVKVSKLAKLEQREAARKAALTEPMPNVPIQLSIKTTKAVAASTSDIEMQQEKDVPGIYSHSKAMQRLDAIFTKAPSKEEAEEVISNLRELHNAVDGLMKVKDFQKARTAATLMLSCLPSMDIPKLWENFTPEQMNEISGLLEKTTGNLFEAKFRLGDGVLWPDELIHVWNSKAVMLSLVRERYARLKSEALARLQDPELREKAGFNEVPTAEEWDHYFDGRKNIKKHAEFLKTLGIPFESAEALIMRNYTLESTKICHLIEKDPYLHFGEDPLLDKKANALVAFFKNDQKGRKSILFNAFEEKRPRNRFTGLVQSAVLPIREAYDMPTPEMEEFTARAMKEIERSEEPLLPSFLIDLRRHEVWADGLFNPKGTLYIAFPNTVQGGAGAISWATTNYAKAKETSEEQSEISLALRDMQYLDARKRLAEMGRLSIQIGSTVFDDKNPAVRILSEPMPNASTESTYGLCLYPRRLPPKLRLLDEPENPHLYQPVLGMMPEALALSQLGSKVGIAAKKLSPEDFEEIDKEQTKRLYSPPQDPHLEYKQTPALLLVNASAEGSLSNLDPLDRYRVTSLRSTKPCYTSFRVWQLIQNSPHLIDNPILQNHLLSLLFDKQALRMHFFREPQEFIPIVRNLDAQIRENLEKGNLIRAAFLSFLSKRLEQEVEEASVFWEKIKDNDETAFEQMLNWQRSLRPSDALSKLDVENYQKKCATEAKDKLKALEKLKDTFPSADTKYEGVLPDKKEAKLSVRDAMLKLFSEPKKDTDIKSLALFILADLNETTLDTLSADDTAILLEAWHIVRSSQTDISIPNLRELIVMKMEKTLLPLIAQKMASDKEFSKKVLFHLSGLEPPEWQIDNADPCKFFTTEATVNIATGEVSGSMKTRLTGANLRFPIPDEITGDERYIRLFGSARFSAKITTSKDNPAQQEYQFELGGREFTLVYDRKKKDLSIYQSFTVKDSHQPQQTVKFKFVENVKCSEKSNFAKTIQHYGVWVNETNSHHALLIPGKMQDWTKLDDLLKDAFKISLDETGTLITNSKRMYVIQDSEHIATPYFPFVEESDIVFLTDSSENKIKQVRLLKEKMEFEVTAEGNLRPLDKEPGWECWFSNTKELVDRFGPAYEQYILPIKKGKMVELRLFPHAINPLRRRGETESLLNFDKKDPWEMSLPTLTVKIDDQGRMHGSHAGFLYLAYVAFAQGDLDRAALYLDEASRADKTDPKEVEVIRLILSMLREQPHATAKTVAFQLKAEMTARQILRDYYHVPEFDLANWEAHTNEIERILTLYKEYENAINDPDKEHQLKTAKLLLTEQEEAEFDRFRFESIQTLVQVQEPRLEVPSAEEIKQKRVDSLSESPEFMNYFILWMEPAIPGATKEKVLKMGMLPTPENVLKNFWTYWELIAKKELKLEDLAPLMLPISAAKGSDPALINAVDFARRLLLTFAHYVNQMHSGLIAKKEADIANLKNKLEEQKSLLEAAKKDIKEGDEDKLVLLEQELKELKEQVADSEVIQKKTTAHDDLKQRVDKPEKIISAINKTEENISNQNTELRRLKELSKTLFTTKQEKTGKTNFETSFPSPGKEIFEAKQNLLPEEIKMAEAKLIGYDQLISAYQGHKQKTHTDAIKKISEALKGSDKVKGFISLMLQGGAAVEIDDESTTLLGAKQIVPAELSTFEAKITPPTPTKLSLQQFRDQVGKATLPAEEKKLYLEALKRVESSTEPEPINDLLRKLLSEGKMPMVALRRYNATKEAIRKLESQPEVQLPFVESKIELDKKKPTQLETFFTADLRLPTKRQVQRLGAVFKEQRQYHAAWLQTYNQILGANEQVLQEQIAKEPVRITSTKDVAQFLLSSAAKIRLAEINNNVAQIQLVNITHANLQIISQDLTTLSKQYEDHLKLEQIALIDQRSEAAKEPFSEVPESTPEEMRDMVAHENERFIKGLEEATDKKKAMINSRKGYISEQQLGQLIDTLQNGIIRNGSLLKQKQEEIFNAFIPFADHFELGTIFRNPEKYTAQERMNLIIDLCEDGRLSKEIKDDTKRDQLLSLIANYLFTATEMQQQEKALDDAAKLHSLALRRESLQVQHQEISAKIANFWTSSDIKPELERQAQQVKEQIEELELEWKELSSSIQDKIEAGANNKRFSDESYESYKELNEQILKLENELQSTKDNIERAKELETLIAELKERREKAKSYKATILDVLNKKITQFGKELQTVKDEIKIVEQQRNNAGKTTEGKAKLPELKAKFEQLHQKSKELETLIKELDARKDKIQEQTGPIIDQEQTLPCLVREYRQKLIFTRAQIEKIETMLDDPNALEEFRMGLGKSSVIFPCVSRILINRGKFPICLFTEELIEQSRKDMDKKAYFFQFNRNSSVAAPDLAEEYLTLCKVKRSGRYLMATVERVAALENKIIELEKKLKELWEESNKIEEAKAKKEEEEKAKTPLPETPKTESTGQPSTGGAGLPTTAQAKPASKWGFFGKAAESLKKGAAVATTKAAEAKKQAFVEPEQHKLFDEMSEKLEQLYWLKNIASLFDDPNTRIVADEIDEIFSIVSEKNYSDGLREPINKIAFDSGKMIFEYIITPKDGEDPAITEFREALLNDGLSNYKKEKIQAAMKALASALYDDDNFWLNNGWTLDDRPNKEEFAEFLSNIETLELPRGMPKWNEAGNKKVAFIGALRHWFTMTLPTLCEKQDGKDYGFGPNGFSVVPFKEQRTKPNTMFGQEAELIGYHLLAYVRNSKNPEFDKFVLSQIPDIQTRASKSADSQWRTWLNKLDPEKTNDPKVILQNLRVQENYTQRVEFLEFIMRESPRIDVFHSQLARNVQDTILGRKVAGASGTMSRYSLPEQFSYDRYKDARTGTGDTLLRLALMGKGFNEKVGIFTDLMDQITQLTKDTKCKAIINQGYATPNMTSRDVIAYLRSEEEKAIKAGQLKREDRRQYVFVDPQTKQAYLWMPDNLSPEPFDKDLDAHKISSAKVLYYFGPADTRGTDFKIPYGYGALIVGPTTTPDEFDQAIWRLRGLGQGQDCKMFAKKTHSEQFAPGVEKPLFKHLISAVALKGVQSNATVNLKAASNRPEAALKQEVKKAIFTPSGSSDRFLKAKQDLIARQQVGKEIRGTAESFKAVESLFVRSKELNFESDYTPSVMVDIMPFLKDKYDQMVTTIDGTKDKPGILQKLPSATLDTDPGATRVKDFHSKVLLAKSNIAEEGKKLDDKKNEEFHKKFLQSKVSKSETGQKDAQAEVQEQQQQQQQQQEQTQTSQEKKSTKFNALSDAARGSAGEHQRVGSFNYVMSQVSLPVYSMNALYPSCGLDASLLINLTLSSKEWMKVCPPIGRSTGYLVTGYNNNKSTWITTWITDLDYEDLRSELSIGSGGIVDCFSILSIPETADEPEILYNLNPLGEGKKNYDELNVAIAKLAMGYSTYPEGERKKLFEWFTTQLTEAERNNWINELSHKGAQKPCIAMLQAWSKPNATYVPSPTILEETTPKVTKTREERSKKSQSSFKPTIKSSTKAAEISKDHYDVGGGGRCADYSMVDQLNLLNKGKKETSSADLRRAAGSYLDENKNAIASDEEWMGQIGTALSDYYFDNPTKLPNVKISKVTELKEVLRKNYTNNPEKFPTIKQKSDIDTLKDRDSITAYINSLEPEILIDAYIAYIQQPDTWWDVAAFRALTANRDKIMPGMQIAILQDFKGTYKINSQYPENEILNRDTCLFIWYNQGEQRGGDHYHSFNRESNKLNEAIQSRQEGFFLSFIEILSKAETTELFQNAVRTSLEELSIHDPVSYHAICYLIWRNNNSDEIDYIQFAQEQINLSKDLRTYFSNLYITSEAITYEKKNFALEKGQVIRLS